MFNVKVVCASCKDLQYVWTALAKGSVRTKKKKTKLEENNDDESLRQLEEGTKDVGKNV